MRKSGFAFASLLLPVLTLGGVGWFGALAATGDTLIVIGDGVNVRYGPSTDARIRMQIYYDQLVTELEREGDWVRAEIEGGDGASGWIHASLLELPSAEQLALARARASAPPGAGLPEAKPLASTSGAEATPVQPAPDETTPVPVQPEPAETPPAEVKPVTSEPSNPEPSAPEASTDRPTPAAELGPPVASEPPITGAVAVAPPAPGFEAEPAAGPTDAADAAELARFRDSVDYLNSRSTSIAGVDLFDQVKAVGDGVVQVGATDAWSSIPPGNQQSYANTLLDRWAAARGYSGAAVVQIVGPNGKVLLESRKP